MIALSKSELRLAPLKAVSIPCLELSAATVSVRQEKMFKRESYVPLNVDSFFRTDSMSVLCYVKNESTHFYTFVANLIAMVRDGSTPHQLRHVEGAAIPGDYASRGTTAKALMTCQSWLMGLEFLWKPEGD